MGHGRFRRWEKQKRQESLVNYHLTILNYHLALLLLVDFGGKGVSDRESN